MVRNARLVGLATLWACLSVPLISACNDETPGVEGETSGDGDGDPSTSTDPSTTDPSGDGDGDPSGDGDGDPSGDGDGDVGDGDGDVGDGDGDGDGGGFSFVPPEDFFDADLCDPFLQDCPDGEKCVPYANGGGNWNANKCVPILGDAEIGEPCMYDGAVAGTDTCDGSSMCWNTDDEQVGTCVAFCTGTLDNPMCDPGSSCTIQNNNSITLCLENCDPLVQDCGPGLGCFWGGGAFQCVFTTQDLPTGEPCGFLNDCAPGNYCTAAETLPNCGGGSCCANYCDLDNGNGDCFTPGTECVPFYEPNEAPPGEQDIGLCLLP